MSVRLRGPRARSSRTFRWIGLDVTDLRAVETNLAMLGPVEITSDEVEGTASSVDELSNLGVRRLENVDVRARMRESPGQVWLSVEKNGAYLATSGDDPRAAGVFSQVEQILAQRVIRWRVAAATVAPWAAGLGIALVALGVAGGDVDGLSAIASVSLFVGALISIVGMSTGLIATFPSVSVLLVSRESQPSWWRRNRDALIVQFIVGAALLVVGFLLGRAV